MLGNEYPEVLMSWVMSWMYEAEVGNELDVWGKEKIKYDS